MILVIILGFYITVFGTVLGIGMLQAAMGRVEIGREPHTQDPLRSLGLALNQTKRKGGEWGGAARSRKREFLNKGRFLSSP